MLQTTKRIIHEDVTSTVAKEEYGKTDRKRAHCAGGFQVVFGARALPARWRV